MPTIKVLNVPARFKFWRLGDGTLSWAFFNNCEKTYNLVMHFTLWIVCFAFCT